MLVIGNYWKHVVTVISVLVANAGHTVSSDRLRYTPRTKRNKARETKRGTSRISTVYPQVVAFQSLKTRT